MRDGNGAIDRAGAVTDRSTLGRVLSYGRVGVKVQCPRAERLGFPQIPYPRFSIMYFSLNWRIWPSSAKL